MNSSLVQRAWRGAAAAVLAVLVGGCAGYRLGSTLPPGIRSVYVPTFVNRTGEPLLEATATAATLQEIQRDGTLALGEAGGADAILEVTLDRLVLEPLRYQRDRGKTTSEYRLRIRAELTFKERRSGKVLSQRKVEGEATFPPLGDLASGKRQAIPTAARDLAHDIVESVVEYWY